MTRALEVKDSSGKLKYDVRPGKRTGGRKRLAEDAGMDIGQLSRLLSGERMPDTRFLAGLAQALGTTVDKLLSDSDNYPPQTAPRKQRKSVGSPSITPDEVAKSWGVDPARMRAMYEELRKTPGATTEADQDGSVEAQG